MRQKMVQKSSCLEEMVERNIVYQRQNEKKKKKGYVVIKEVEVVGWGQSGGEGDGKVGEDQGEKIVIGGGITPTEAGKTPTGDGVTPIDSGITHVGTCMGDDVASIVTMATPMEEGSDKVPTTNAYVELAGRRAMIVKMRKLGPMRKEAPIDEGQQKKESVTNQNGKKEKE